MEQERATALEATFESLSDTELIDQFYVSEGNPVIGKELAVRIFAHANFTDDPNTTPLIGRDGKQVVQAGQPLVLSDYVNFAVTHHFDAVEGILDFLRMKSGTQDYETVRQSVVGRLRADGA